MVGSGDPDRFVHHLTGTSSFEGADHARDAHTVVGVPLVVKTALDI